MLGQASSLLQSLKKPLVSWRYFARIQGYTAPCRSSLQGPCTGQCTPHKFTFLPFLPHPPPGQPIDMKEKEESDKPPQEMSMSLQIPFFHDKPFIQQVLFTATHLDICKPVFSSPFLLCSGCSAPSVYSIVICLGHSLVTASVPLVYSEISM